MPGCLAQRAHWAEPLLTTLGVLRSPPWLFVNLLATQEGKSNKASTGNLKTFTKQDQGMAVKTRVSSAFRHTHHGPKIKEWLASSKKRGDWD